MAQRADSHCAPVNALWEGAGALFGKNTDRLAYAIHHCCQRWQCAVDSQWEFRAWMCLRSQPLTIKYNKYTSKVSRRIYEHKSWHISQDVGCCKKFRTLCFLQTLAFCELCHSSRMRGGQNGRFCPFVKHHQGYVRVGVKLASQRDISFTNLTSRMRFHPAFFTGGCSVSDAHAYHPGIEFAKWHSRLLFSETLIWCHVFVILYRVVLSCHVCLCLCCEMCVKLMPCLCSACINIELQCIVSTRYQHMISAFH